ncbi:BtrH N-terminal domain-containing protein [Halioxenophilus sp. WMMB6]|uniref:BtrH N-terminal domain-containing protein n=1 Tax=Halioxenophilus sp. WMMB6 TaxID=3073815 RepID=UPI00295E43AD|nr:BtrH N-terminal domain-containing protein [Halioxenophilus sp. WMMB6]
MNQALVNHSFQHRQAAHCETGVASALLSHNGLPLSEPMAFGLAAGLSFAYLPIVKLSGMPLIAYRMPPRAILKGLQQRLGVKLHFQTFSDPAKGMAELDKQLDQGRLVGLQTSVFWLPYFPETMRFHFNAHNLLVYGRDGDDYLISDPVFEEGVRCDRQALQKARFAKGALAAKGMLYYPTQVPQQFDLATTARAAIRKNYRIMMNAPLPMIGVKGIRYLGKKIVQLSGDSKKSERYLPLYLSHIVRMQEEIGTGGAGFRFIYAAFLREVGQALANDRLKEAAAIMTEAGDDWRKFALLSSKMCKGRSPMDSKLLQATLNGCADQEAQAWRLLKQF